MSVSESLQPANTFVMLCGKGKLSLQMELRLLINRFSNAENILDYLVRTNTITNVLTS